MIPENLAKLLEVASLRHRVIAHNIANLNTPGFQKKEVEFEKFLDRARLQQTIVETAPKVVAKEETTRLDHNSSSLEQEMQELAHNSLKYQVFLQALANKIKGLDTAISGRSR